MRFRFLQVLEERQSRIAAHILAAWDGESVVAVNSNLSAVQFILAKTAEGALANGFPDLAENARRSHDEISAHLDGEDADLAICPGELVFYVDETVALCRDIIANAG